MAGHVECIAWIRNA